VVDLEFETMFNVGHLSFKVHEAQLNEPISDQNKEMITLTEHSFQWNKSDLAETAKK
jgi:hypothetical protein